ncbi:MULTISPECIES: YcfL family protein [unclassified Vibrio]|uniref:DUF1425 domain-containing protein n=1 Tax=Vibrio sp. HB236076 TaxID=3232307 RepID=A0AB39HIU2_9VIBR|nr:DUF1425 domain-containing protein [Vibrio sp. HB161653]MDP5255126.1 DUF1425 domain-containing protein [Vibrio sp. HB161653]
MMKCVVALVGLIALSGCVNHSTEGIKVDGSQQQVIFTDSELAQNLKVLKLQSVNDQERHLAKVYLHNTFSKTLTLNYRFYWYDDKGLEVSQRLSPWQQQRIDSNEVVVISDTSPTIQGTQFRVQIK